MTKKSNLVVIVVIALCLHKTTSNTVHFTNSKSKLQDTLKSLETDNSIKAYQLEVPGSAPITIIETQNKNDKESKALRERKTKDYIVPGSTHEQEINYANEDKCFGPSCQDNIPKKTVYSPDLLNKFLKEYAEKIKNADQKIKERLQKLEINTERDNIATANKGYQKKKITEKIDMQIQPEETKKSWNQFESKRHKHPYEDHDGWVTLEAVPWTKSKISKWQANTYKVNKPSYSYDKDPYDRYPPSYYDKPDLEIDHDKHRPYNKPDFNNYNRPSYTDEWPEEPSRPSWAKPSKPSNFYNSWNNENSYHQHNANCNHNNGYDDDNRRGSYQYYENDGVITDGRPSNFPGTSPGHRYKDMLYNRPTEVVYADFPSTHPASHPSNGDGQWILLSTTKGYQFPNKRERSLSVNVDPLITKAAVKLTVLPNKNDNMSTSHGGMLEVDSNLQSVDESKKVHDRLNKWNATRLKHIKLKNVMTTDPNPDGSAVMAAVGAGLIPATMAMIMPMVLGRKKRFTNNLNNFHSQNVTQQPHFTYESTIQRTLK